MSQDGVDDLAHRQDDATQFDEIFADLVRGALNIGAGGLLVEQAVLEILHRVIEDLHGIEMSVDDGVEQAVHERTDAVLEQVRVVVPAPHHFFMSKSGPGAR